MSEVNFSEVLLFSCAILFLYISLKYAFKRPDGFPPGPPRIPIFGSYLFMMMANFKYTHKAVVKLSKWYNSDIVGFYFGAFPVVAVHNAEGVREILFNEDFGGRPKVFVAKMRDPNFKIKGIFFEDGHLWKEQRRFILRHLRDFGFGRRFEELELVIKEEITDMIDLIRNGPRYEHEKGMVSSRGYRILLPYIFNPFSANSFFHIMGTERHPRAAQAELLELVRQGMIFQRESDDYGKMLSAIPWIRHIFPNWSSYNTLMKANKYIYGYFEKLVDFHIDSYDESCERNFLDLYIKEMKKADASGIEDSTFSRSQLIMSLIDFAFPAFTAIGTQISLLIQYFLLHPEVQERIQHEIDEVVGSGRLPCLEDRKNMHYTEATIRECLRIETLVPSDVPHLALVDTQLLGYKIPKDTVIIPSLYAYHRDKRVWKDPETFEPERFLNEDGHLSLGKDISLPFGAGKRLCAGETFARNMLFLMVAALCQNFTFVLGPDDVLPDPSKNLSGLIISPPDFWVQLVERT